MIPKRDTYNDARQTRLFAVLLFTNMLAQARSHIRPEVFDSEPLQKAASTLLRCFDSANKVPSQASFYVEIDQEHGRDEAIVILTHVKRAYNLDAEEVDKIYKPQFVELLKGCILQASLRLQGEALERGDIEEVYRLQASSTLVIDLPKVTAFSELDLEARYLGDEESVDGRGCILPLGYEEWDRLMGGGGATGEFHWIIGPQGRGKTRLMGNMALRYAMRGSKVFYISFELKRQVLEYRTHLMMARATNDTIRSPEAVDVVRNQIEKMKAAGGELFIEKFRPHSMTAKGVAAWLRSQPVKPDVVFLDYLGLMELETSKRSPSIWYDQEIAYSRLAAACEEMGFLLWGADQPTKGQEEITERKHVAGAGAKFDPVSSGWAIRIRGEELKSMGTFSMLCLKNRFGEEGEAFLQVAPNGLTVDDAVEMPPETEI